MKKLLRSQPGRKYKVKKHPAEDKKENDRTIKGFSHVLNPVRRTVGLMISEDLDLNMVAIQAIWYKKDAKRHVPVWQVFVKVPAVELLKNQGTTALCLALEKLLSTDWGGWGGKILFPTHLHVFHQFRLRGRISSKTLHEKLTACKNKLTGEYDIQPTLPQWGRICSYLNALELQLAGSQTGPALLKYRIQLGLLNDLERAMWNIKSPHLPRVPRTTKKPPFCCYLNLEYVDKRLSLTKGTISKMVEDKILPYYTVAEGYDNEDKDPRRVTWEDVCSIIKVGK